MFIIQRTKWICSLLIVLIVILVMLSTLTSVNIDYIISYYATMLTETLLYQFSFHITKLGSSPFLIPFMIFIMFGLILLYRRLGPAIIISSMTLLTFLVNELLKMFIKRERPSILQDAQAIGYSYPSGHAMISLVFYSLLLYFVQKKVTNKKVKIGLFILVISLIIMIGLSRIVLNVHYVSDVLSGFLFGLILFEVAVYLEGKIR